MAGCRANLDLEAEKLNCEIAELENSVKHLVGIFSDSSIGTVWRVCVRSLRCGVGSLHSTTPLLPRPQTQRRSNEELAAALEAAPDDPDFAAAMQENESVIGKREALLEELRKELRGLRASLVQAVDANLAALDLQKPVAVGGGGGGGGGAPVAVASSGGPQMGLDEGVDDEKAEGVYL